MRHVIWGFPSARCIEKLNNTNWKSNHKHEVHFFNFCFIVLFVRRFSEVFDDGPEHADPAGAWIDLDEITVGVLDQARGRPG